MCYRGRVKLKPCAGQSCTDHRQTLPQAELRCPLLLPLLGLVDGVRVLWESVQELILEQGGSITASTRLCVRTYQQVCQQWWGVALDLTWCRTHQEDQPASAMWEFPQPLFLQVNMNLVAYFCKNLEIHNI